MTSGLKRFPVVFLSPHLDDAVFSCGGTLAALAGRTPVLVLNVFTRGTAWKKGRPTGDTCDAQRRTEEQRAAELLGYTPMFLGKTDAIARKGGSIAAVFSRPTASDAALAARLSNTLSGLLADAGCETLYAPLGIGHHTDHLICCEAVRRLKAPPRVLYYEDQPYGFFPHAGEYRRRGLGLVSDLAPPKGLLRDWRRTTAFYLRGALMKNLKPWPVRWAAKPVVAAYLLQMMSRLRANWRDSGNQFAAARVEDVTASWETKIAAMRAYASQFGEFFSNSDECEVLHREYSRKALGVNGIGERFWETL